MKNRIAKLIETGLILNNSYVIDWQGSNRVGDILDFEDLCASVLSLYENRFQENTITDFLNNSKIIVQKYIDAFLSEELEDFFVIDEKLKYNLIWDYKKLGFSEVFVNDGDFIIRDRFISDAIFGNGKFIIQDNNFSSTSCYNVFSKKEMRECILHLLSYQYYNLDLCSLNCNSISDLERLNKQMKTRVEYLKEIETLEV